MVKKLNREGIQRMVRNTTTAGNVVNRGGGGVDLAGYATQAWVDEGYLSKEFFNRLFTIHGANNTTITPNDTDSTISSIESMFGFWTNLYITALGNGGDIGSAIYLSQLADVNVAGVQNGQALVYNSATGKWIPGTGGIDLTAMWTALATSDSTKQIDGSHLSTALGAYAYISNGTIHLGTNSITPVTSLVGYATESWVNTQISDMATKTWVNTQISDMATQTWVNTQISDMATKTWVNSNFITVAFFDRLFRAYNGSTLVNANDTTTTIDNIKAMFGFWTEFYLSALGTGGASGVSIALGQLSDVVLTSPTNGQALVYDAANSQWVNGTVSGGGTGNYLPLTGGTMTGDILLHDEVAIEWSPSTGFSGYVRMPFRIKDGSYFTGINSYNSGGNTYTKLGIFTDKYGQGNDTNSIFLYPNSAPKIGANTIWHAGNFTPSDYLPLSGGTMTGSITMNQTSSTRTVGIIGTYDANRAAAIWSMGSSYQIKADGTTFGSLYGAAYAFFGSGYTFGAGKSGGHSFVWCQNGSPYVALGNYVWSTNGYKKNGATDSDVLLGNGGHTAISGLSVYYASYSGYSNKVLGSYTTNGGQQNPNYFGTNRVGFLMMNTTVNGNSQYKDWVIMDCYHGTDVGGGVAFGVNRQSLGAYIMRSAAARTSWADSAELIGTHNYTTYTVKKDGTGASGSWGISITGNAASATKLQTARTIWGQSFNGTGNVDGILYVTANSNTVSIGSLNSSWCHIYNSASINFIFNKSIYTIGGLYPYGSAYNIGSTSERWGSVYCTNVYASGAVSATSDIRKKDIQGNLNLNVEQIADAPAIKFLWKADHLLGMQAGTIAQYWQKVLPEVVSKQDDAEGTLGLSYGVASLMSSIIIARRVVNHEQRIRELEKENQRLRTELKQIRLSI